MVTILRARLNAPLALFALPFIRTSMLPFALPRPTCFALQPRGASLLQPVHAHHRHGAVGSLALESHLPAWALARTLQAILLL